MEGAELPPLPAHAIVARGREALDQILGCLHLRPTDDIWISTTMGFHGLHISPCVTAVIARHCRFTPEPGQHTAAALVIHDYGVPHPHLAQIRAQCDRHGWPLIEDAAHAFASLDAEGRRMGTVGDFAFFSLPKYFAVAAGGLVAGVPAGAVGLADEELTRRYSRVLGLTDTIRQQRLQNWRQLDAQFSAMGMATALPLPTGSVPMAYTLETRSQFATQRRLRAAAIESGPEVACGHVLLPCHQRLSPGDLVRIVAAVAEGATPVHPSSPATPLCLLPCQPGVTA